MFSWDVETEGGNFRGSGKGKRVRFPLWSFITNVENLNAVQFFVKLLTKSYCSINQPLQQNLFIDQWLARYRAIHPPPSIRRRTMLPTESF